LERLNNRNWLPPEGPTWHCTLCGADKGQLDIPYLLMVNKRQYLFCNVSEPAEWRRQSSIAAWDEFKSARREMIATVINLFSSGRTRK
jgi:hypothetical protein